MACHLNRYGDVINHVMHTCRLRERWQSTSNYMYNEPHLLPLTNSQSTSTHGTNVYSDNTNNHTTSKFYSILSIIITWIVLVIILERNSAIQTPIHVLSQLFKTNLGELYEDELINICFSKSRYITRLPHTPLNSSRRKKLK